MSKIFLTRTQRVLSGKLKYAVLATVFLATVSLAEAQHSGKMYQIGLLALATPEQYAPLRKVLEEGLRGLGYVGGRILFLSAVLPTERRNGLRISPRSWCGSSWM